MLQWQNIYAHPVLNAVFRDGYYEPTISLTRWLEWWELNMSDIWCD